MPYPLFARREPEPYRWTQTCLFPGNCWQTAVACLLRVPAGRLPDQARYDRRRRLPDGGWEWEHGVRSYHSVLQAYLGRHHGLAYCEVHAPDEILGPLRCVGFHLMTGLTERSPDNGGMRHVVVGRRGELWWDPHPSRAGLLSEVRWAFLVPRPKVWRDPVEQVECECPECFSALA